MNNIQKTLHNVTLFQALFDLDCELAEYVRLQGCPYCGGTLHYGRYARSPKGSFVTLSKIFRLRQSLCCSQRNCRHRTLPPSCLFMGRKVTFRCAILVFLTLWYNREHPVFELSEILGVDVRTLQRWRAYFRDEFPHSSIWQRLRGFIKATLCDYKLPGALVMSILSQIKNTTQALLRCIVFLVSGETPIIKKIEGNVMYAEDAS